MNRSRISRIFLAAVAGALAAGTTHVVVKGDTLWDITGKYLGNPFQWPSVWQKNPQIKNAHWIYPGDKIALDENGQPVVESKNSNAGNDTSGAPAVVGNDPLAGFPANPLNQKVVSVDTTGGNIDLVIPPTHSVLSLEMVVNAPVLYPVDQPLPNLQSEVVYDGEYGLRQLLPGFVVGAKFGSDDGIKLGDRVEIVERDEKVATIVLGGTKGRLEEVRALADVVEVRKHSLLCRLVAVYGLVGANAKIRPFQMPVAASVTAFQDVRDEAPAQVLVNNRLGRVQMPNTSVIIDRGESDGIGQGDIYEFMSAGAERGMLAMRGYGMVVRTTRTSATIKIVGATTKPVEVGDKAWRVRRSVRG